MLDTGANCCAISEPFCQTNNLIILSERSTTCSFNGDPIDSVGYTIVDLNFGPIIKRKVKCLVFPSLPHNVILTGGLFKQISVEYPDGSDDSHFVILLDKYRVTAVPRKSFNIFATCEYTVPASSVRYYKIDNPKMPLKLNVSYYPHPETVKLKPLSFMPVYCSDKTYMAVENTEPYPVTIPKGFPIYEAVPDLSCNALIHVGDTENEQKRHEDHIKFRCEKFNSDKQKVTVEFGPQISQNTDRTLQVNELINKYRLAFSASKYDIGLVRSYRYGVSLKPDAKVWYQAPRRISPKVQPQIENMFQTETEFRLLEHASSEYSIPLVVVRKSDGDLRVCMDMRLANSELLCQKFPLPDMGHVLDCVSQSITNAPSDSELFICKFDIRAAYRQLEITDEDKDKFSFSHNGKMYRNTRMIFGVADGPATYSRLGSLIFRTMPNCFVYFDDLCSVHVGFSNMMADLHQIFKTCENAGIVLAPNKCIIGADEINLLGYKISRSGITLRQDKVTKLLAIKPPANKDDVRSLLGGMNFYRSFCPNLITTLSPLFEILKKNVTFVWGQKQQNAFRTAKELLANHVKKAHRNYNYPLVVLADASLKGCGGTLCQRKPDGNLETLSFYSRGFSPTEQRAPIRHRELYSIFYCIQNWNSELMYEEFYVHSDHKSLQFYRNTKLNFLSTRLINLIHFLNRFRFSIVYISGTDKNFLPADMMSRAPFFCDQPEMPDVDILEKDDLGTFQINNINIFPFSLDFFRDRQTSCPKITKLTAMCKKPYFVSNDKILMKQIKDFSVICLPPDAIAEVVNYTHHKKGHLSGPKLHRFLRLHFHGRNLRAECLRIAGHCPECCAVKCIPKLKVQGPNLPDVDNVPFSKVYTDLVDMGTSCQEGYRYGLTYMDQLTRFCDLIPLKDKKPESVVRGLIILFTRYGLPERLISDNGAEYKSRLTEEVLNTFGVYVSHISPYRPGGNIIERFHRDLGELLKIHNVPITTWSSQIHFILYLYNQTSLKILNDLCPFECLFLRPPRAPFEFAVRKKISAKWIELFGPSADDIFHKVAQIHMNRFNANKLWTDKAPVSLKRGSRVLVFKPLKPGMSRKLTRKWVGPLVVIRKSNNDVYVLRDVMTQRRIKRHVSHIRLLHDNDNVVSHEDSDISNSNVIDGDGNISGTDVNEEVSSQAATAGSCVPLDINVPSMDSQLPAVMPVPQTEKLNNVKSPVTLNTDLTKSTTPTTSRRQRKLPSRFDGYAMHVMEHHFTMDKTVPCHFFDCPNS